jgi:hypothetical protein
MQEPTPPSADASASYAATNGLVCFSAGDCIGVATFSSGTAVLTQSSGTWSVAPLPLPANAASSAGQSRLSSVACTTSGSCTAVGAYATQTGAAGDIEPMVLTESAGTWSATELPLPANAAVTNS